MRVLYYLGLSYAAFCVALSLGALLSPPAWRGGTILIEMPLQAFTPEAWFASIKSSCNPVEVDIQLERTPPPPSTEGLGYGAACYALAGEIDRARDILRSVQSAEQWQAAGRVFEAVHPAADAGDDIAAGPAMELVLEFWPNHYMALYHAGMSRYARGDSDAATRLLQAFRDVYSVNDGWRRNAEVVLARMGR